MTTETPHDDRFDSSLAFLRDPYGFISKRCRAARSDVVEARLLLRKTLLLSGREAAELFYDARRFVRAGAAPEPLVHTLFGAGAVQSTDGEEHRVRKAAFLSLLGPEGVAALAGHVERVWEEAARRWTNRPRVVLYDEAQEILTRAVCAWAGVPLEEVDVARRTRQLADLYDKAGAKGLGHLRSRLSRARAEEWMEGIVKEVRAGRRVPPAASPLSVLAHLRDAAGNALPARVAAVELLNLLRPTVAVSVYVTHVALALHRFPEARERLRAGEAGYADAFVDEVRRYFPFFPAVAARAKVEFSWKGVLFPQGRRVMLDLHGTNHDARSWEDPGVFRPERFLRGEGRDPFAFVPQGGGDARTGHRCPGEGAARAIMRLAAEKLTRRTTFDVPRQDLRIDYRRLPALPRSGFVMTDVRLVGRRVEGATKGTREDQRPADRDSMISTL